MRTSMTIGKRIGLGFGMVVTLLTGMVVLSYVGVKGIVGDAQDVIEGNRLDGVMAQKEVDHLNWANQVSGLLTDDAVTQLDAQLDHTKCKTGQWLASPERQDAEQRVPSLSPLLAELDTRHQALHTSAKAIGDAHRQPHPGLG